MNMYVRVYVCMYIYIYIYMFICTHTWVTIGVITKVAIGATVIKGYHICDDMVSGLRIEL